MTVFEIILMAVALAMDAFAVAICKGLATEKATFKNMLIVGVWFGSFQALMPFIGCTVGSAFMSYIEGLDHWIAFVLLGFIGGNMIREALSRENECECDCEDSSFAPKVMLTMAIATSIDALAAGVGMSVDLSGMGQIIFAVLMIGVITCILSAVGVKIGNVFGAKYKFVAELSGGTVLVGMGIKILIEHMLFA
jgi:putative Mn2+ efflux pump MntP